MRTMREGLGRALAAGSAVLMLAACDSASNPTAPAAQEAAVKAAEAAAAAIPVSATVHGTVVDSSGRPIADANVECLGNVQCTLPETEVSAQGHQHRVGQTDANGTYAIVATSTSGDGGFLMNANGQGYEVAWRSVSWPRAACSSDQPGCTLTVNFQLNPAQDLSP